MAAGQRAHGHGAALGDTTGEDGGESALRAELFSAEQMEQHGVALARQHRLSPRSSSDRLLRRLDDNAAVLAAACETLTAVTQASRDLFGNTGLGPGSDAWSLQHPVAYTLFWVVGIILVFAPLSVRQYRLTTSR